MFKLRRIILLAIFMFLPVIQALKVELLSALPEIVATKNIALRFCFEEQDYAIYKHFLQFFFDASVCKIESWKSASVPFLEYVVPFKANKLVYVESLRVDLSIAFSPTYRKEDLMREFERTNLIVSCIVLGKDKKNKSFSQVIPLALPQLSVIQIYEKGTQAVDVKAVELYASTVDMVVKRRSQPLEKEEFWLDQFLPLSNKVSGYLYYFLSWPVFFPWYLFFTCLVLLMVLGCLLWRRSQSRYWREAERFVFFLFLGHNFYFLQFMMPSYQALYLFSFFCVISSGYYFFSSEKKGYVLNKICLMVGIGVLLCAIFTATKAVLLQIVN